MDDQIKILKDKKVFEIRDGSAEVFFDDVGVIQQIVYRIKKVKHEGEPLELRSLPRAHNAMAYFDPTGTVKKIVYESTWKKSKENLT